MSGVIRAHERAAHAWCARFMTRVERAFLVRPTSRRLDWLVRLIRESERDGNPSGYQRVRADRAAGVPGAVRPGLAGQGDRRRGRRRHLHRRRLLRLPDEVRLGARPLQARALQQEEQPVGRGQRRAGRRRRRDQVPHGDEGAEPAALEGAGRRLRDRVDRPLHRRREGQGPPRGRARRRSSSPRPARAR